MTTKTLHQCPVCDEGQLEPREREEKVLLKDGNEGVFSYSFSVCSDCGSELTTPSQTKVNQARIADARRFAEGLLTSDEIKAVRDTLGLTQSDAANLFGGGPNSFSKYERGEVIQSVAMDRLIRLASENRQVVVRLTEMAVGERVQFQVNKRYQSWDVDIVANYVERPLCRPAVHFAKFRTVETANQHEPEWVNDSFGDQRVANG